MAIELRRMENKYLLDVLEFFSDRGFFFKTKRPESLSEGIIKRLIENGQITFILFYNDTPSGLVSFDTDTDDRNSVFLNLRLKDMSILIDNCEEIFDAILNHMDNYRMIKCRIFAFDDWGRKFCDRMGFDVEAVLEKHVYKARQYNDLIIYSKKLNRQGD